MKNDYYKHPQYGMVFGVDTLGPIGRAAWPCLVKPKDPPPALAGQEQGAPRYEVTLLLPKADPKVMLFKEEIETVAEEMVELFNQGKKTQIAIGEVFSDGDSGKMDLEKYPFYAECWYIVLRNKDLPPIVDKAKQKIEPSAVQGGMKCRANLQPLVTSHGVSYKLKALQLWDDDGVRFGGGTRDVLDLFGDCEDAGCAKVPKPDNEPDTEVDDPPKLKKRKNGKEAALDLL